MEFDDCRGGICVENSGTIENCFNTGNINSTFTKSWAAPSGAVGGITGENKSGGKIINCVNYGTITVKNGHPGAISGYTASGSTVKNCYWKKDCSKNGSSGTDTQNYMVSPSSYSYGSHTGGGYFEGNTGTTLTAGNSQTLAYGTNLLNALNAYVTANPNNGLKEWQSNGTYAAVLKY